MVICSQIYIDFIVDFLLPLDLNVVRACCGITYSKALNWTLRNGGFVKKIDKTDGEFGTPEHRNCLLYTSPSPRDGLLSRMPSSA